MVKNHLKSIAAPKAWHIARKAAKFITRPLPGAHTLDSATSLSTLMRTTLKIGKTSKEIKFILNNKEVLLDGIRVKEPRRIVGLMDVISFKDINKSHRVLLDKKGRLTTIEISEKEAKMKLLKIKSKSKISGNKIQLNCSSGRNIILSKDEYKTGDALEIELPSQKILNHFKFDKGAPILLIGGKHAGASAKIEKINDKKIIFSLESGEKYETLRKYAFVIGKDTPAIKLE